ncbi:MAG: hypothetical protein QOI98_1996 [Solirubrobacteraceae bacterium]|nr:hypothetical protein [Solirubrobacteraceae bacterium]
MHPTSEPDFPVADYLAGEPIPNLARIPVRDWRRVMAPLTMPARRAAIRTSPTDHLSEAMVIGAELEIEDIDRRARREAVLAHAVAVPTPSVSPRPRSRSRQVNFRLGPNASSRLDRAAELLGMKPGALARSLTLNGVNRILYEDARIAEDARTPDAESDS